MTLVQPKPNTAHILPHEAERLHEMILKGISYRTIQRSTGHSLTTITQHSQKLRGKQPRMSRVVPTKTHRDRSYGSIDEIVQHNRDAGRFDLEKTPEFLILKDLFGRRRNIFVTYRAPEYGIQGYEICAILPSGRIERLSGDREFPTRAAAFRKVPLLASRHDAYECDTEGDFE